MFEQFRTKLGFGMRIDGCFHLRVKKSRNLQTEDMYREAS